MAGVPEFNKELRGVQFVAYNRFNLASDTTGKLMFTLPKGGIVLPLGVAMVTTAFDGTTPTVTIGSSGHAAGLWASADVAPATAGVKQQVLATVTGDSVFKAVLTADTDITATVGGGGSNTVGSVIITQPFLYPYKLPDLL